ncbi:hypothetical protein GF415_04235 [Candidatus Micrarchaeota archaeon]|nr:hypothetical protein [Candidatus Micrarchaeota archaeon]
MILLRARSSLKKQELLQLAERRGALLLNPQKLNSVEELLLSEKLAEDSIREKRNIARKKEKEFLLWLSAAKDISSALEKYSFRIPEDFFFVCFSGKKGELKKDFRLEEKPAALRKRATPLEVERISLSRIKK